MLILASKSQTRHALLAGAGLRFVTSPAQIDERALEADVLGKGGDAISVARHLAEAKARAVSTANPGAIAIGADQVLALGDSLLHKPESLAEARLQLDRLKGRSHFLHAGIALAQHGEVLWSEVESARLTLRNFTDAERDAVLTLEGDARAKAVRNIRGGIDANLTVEAVRGPDHADDDAAVVSTATRY